MIKTLVPVGDGVGIVLDEAMFRQLGIGRGTPLDISTDGQSLIIRPLSEEADANRTTRILETADQVMEIHAETLRKLAL